MKEKKRKQHYVFQSYLRAWSTDQKVYALRNNKILHTNPSKLATERDFYRLQKLNTSEYNFCMLLSVKSPNLKEVLKDWLDTYLWFSKLEEQIKQFHNISQLFGSIDEGLEKSYNNMIKHIDIAQNNAMENFLSEIESEGIKWINTLLTFDDSFYDISERTFDDIVYNFLLFITTQYYRTKAYKNRIITNMTKAFTNVPEEYAILLKEQGIKINEVDFEHVWPHYTWTLQILAANNLRKDKAPLTFLKSSSDELFITSDQPVVNLQLDYQDPEAAIEKYEFYYPLNPYIAIVINGDYNEKIVQLSTVDVTDLNNKMATASHEIIFANNRESLEKFFKLH